MSRKRSPRPQSVDAMIGDRYDELTLELERSDSLLKVLIGALEEPRYDLSVLATCALERNERIREKATAIRILTRPGGAE
jgi:hypothetical protein